MSSLGLPENDGGMPGSAYEEVMGRFASNLDPGPEPEVHEDPIKFAEQSLGIEIPGVQKRLIRTIENNRRTLILSGNGVGKSFSIAEFAIFWTVCKINSIGLLTSGTYSQMKDTVWRPMKTMFREAQYHHSQAQEGRIINSDPPRIEMPSDEWYFKLLSPRSSGGIEGRHGQDVLVMIEEADKPDVGPDDIDAAESAVTGTNDRVLVVANPPRDESNVVYRLMQSNRWKTVQFSSFESHNVQVDLGNAEGERIEGLVDLEIIASDWEEWNGRWWPGAAEEYDGEYTGIDDVIEQVRKGGMSRDEMVEILKPGVERARFAHESEEKLDERWFRRRMGMMPRTSSTLHRPFYKHDVDNAVNSEGAREIEVESWSETDHTENRRRIRAILEDNWEDALAFGVDVARGGGDHTVVCTVKGRTKKDDEPNVAVDAVGEGSGVADDLRESHDAIRFQAGTNPVEEEEYENKWTEALLDVGGLLDSLNIPEDEIPLKDQLYIAVRVITLEERWKKKADVLKADPKTVIEEQYGRSPDEFDGLAMACWAYEHGEEARDDDGGGGMFGQGF